ncbi:MAG: PLDc N-terminal domain-containing protein [Nanoarchaeota archaeon]
MMNLEDAFGVTMILFMFFGIMLVILTIIFWIWTIIDVARRDFKNSNERLIWLLLIILLGIIPSIVYYFVVMRPDNKGCMKVGKKEGKKKGKK